MTRAFAITVICSLGVFSTNWAQEPIPTRAVNPIIDITNIDNHIVETRLYLTDRPGVVRGEIELIAATELSELKLALEKGEVVFSNIGPNAETGAPGHVFAAEFDVDIQFNGEQFIDRLSAAQNTSRPPESKYFHRARPRVLLPMSMDNISASSASINKFTSPELSESLAAANISKTNNPADAAEIIGEALGIDPANLPFLRIPGNAASVQQSIRRQLEVPMADIVGEPTIPITPESSLMVTAVQVVEDPTRTYEACLNKGNPDGSWSFGSLMTEMAKKSQKAPVDFTLEWLKTWEEQQSVNGIPVFNQGRKTRMQSTIKATWDALDGTKDGQYAIEKFPARLMAIVNRPDLSERISFTTSGSAGEARFVFGLVEKRGDECETLEFTVIIEYGIQGDNCLAVKNWQQRWKELDRFSPGTDEFNRGLQKITDDFVTFGAQTPEESALNQIRTNENDLGIGLPWEMREYRLNAAGELKLTTLKQTPRWKFNGDGALLEYLVSAGPDISQGKHTVPDHLPGSGDPFLAAVAEIRGNGVWTIPNPSDLPNHDDVRRKFSLGTCTGCHAGETRTKFTHIGNVGRRTWNKEAKLSEFLTGTTDPIKDPVVEEKAYNHDELGERSIAMSNILTSNCFVLAGQPGKQFVH